MWVHDGDDYLDRVVNEELCAPLCWRVAPQGFVIASGEHYFGPPPTFHGLRRLAAFMGLSYDPDAVFRREAAKFVDNIDDIRDAFLARELSYEWSEQPLGLPDAPDELPPAAGKLAAQPPYHGYLGSYTPETGHVVLAAPTIELVAKTIDQAPRHVGSLALLHLSVLALLHNGGDLDGCRWEGFTTGGVPPATVVLAQFFVHRFLLELDDAHLKAALEALTERQAPEYRAWRSMTHVSLEDARAWMLAIRRGTGGLAPIDIDALLAQSG